MFSRFFIERPIFATVLAIVIVIGGVVSLPTLPIAQYPEITPPTVRVSTVYPGANATVLADTVAAPIEQQVNGVENMIYMSSTSANDGSYSLTVTFEVGTNLDMAQVLVQNRVAIAEPKLPEEVKRQGVTTKKQSTAIVLLVTLTSPDSRYDALYLSNYATLNLVDEIKRIPGVGDVSVFGGSDYSMRVWIDPNKLKARGLTMQDVTAAIQEQNVQVAAGQIGQPPAPAGQAFQYSINTLGRLSDADEFSNIILKTDGNRITRVRDVARVELGSQNYNQTAVLNSAPTAAISVYQLPGANALDVAERIRVTMDRLSGNFPEGLEWSIPFDTTKAVEASIAEVYETLFIAIALVFLTIFVFLQDWRATLIPAVTIPVSLVGTFAVMAALGFSINLLTLFGLVLAIGIVVDDAIVVVENVTRLVDDGLAPREAAIRAMEEVSGPVVATTLVLLAVFIPAAFMGGITGALNQQFALTIAAATVISSVNALTLSPALSAILLRRSQVRTTGFFGAFNAFFDRSSRGYGRIVAALVRRTALGMLIFAALTALAGWGFTALPTGFLPTEDQGYFFAVAVLPDAASLERTDQVATKMRKAALDTPGVSDIVTITGYSLLDSSNLSNAVTAFIVTEPWEDRTEPSLSQDAIVDGVRKRLFLGIEEAMAFAFVPPAINGLGVAGGFQMQLQDRGGVGFDVLQQVAMEIVTAGDSQSGLEALNTTFRARVPQLFADINRTQAKTLGIPLDSVFNTLQAALGSAYVNDFNRFGRTYQVNVQADSPFRQKRSDILKLEVRNQAGEMIPLGTVVSVKEAFGPQLVQRYNLYPSATINGEAAPGFSSGTAISLMEQLADSTLPRSMGYEWTGMSYQEKQVGNTTILVFGLAVVLVFLVLAAQYESWTAPAAVIFAVPLGVLGAVAAVAMRGLTNDVYMQIGLVLLVAMASKNAILIVEFAREQRNAGLGILEAAEEAARLRYRPILMTSFSFVLGVLPLVVATGAGAASRRSLGTVVLGGQLSATIIAVLLVPVFFVVFQRLGERGQSAAENTAPAPEQDPSGS